MQRCDASHICPSSPQLNSARLKLRGPFFQHVTPPLPSSAPPCRPAPILAMARRGPPSPDTHFRQRVLTAARVGSSQPIAPVPPPFFSSRDHLARLERRSVRELSQVVKGNRGDRRAGLRGPCVPGRRQISVTAYCKLRCKKKIIKKPA